MAGRRDGWRSWLPLGSAMPMLLLLVLFPSALNVPQTNPSQTLEFAPVPPEDDEPPPPDSGNISTVGLGNTVTGPTVGGDDPASPEAPSAPPPSPPPLPPSVPEGEGARPVTKACVGSPPRQTEDPMSPPCVAHFEGDNGGATAPGVTGNEVVILIYIAAQPISAAAGCADEGCDTETFYDLGRPPEESPHDEREAYWPHAYRTWQRYFNARFQLYERDAHLWVHMGRMDSSPEARLADVADAAAQLDPFAIVADANVNGEVYAEEWAKRGRAVFMSKTSSLEEVGFDRSFFNRYPGQLWDYQPSVQEMADSFASFLCAQVVNHPVSFSGEGNIGEPRRLGLLVPGHPNYQNRINYSNLVREQIEACGADIVDTQHDQDDGNQNPGQTNNTHADRIARMAAMRQAGVTTVVNLAGAFWYSTAAGRLVPPWRPEWVMQQDNAHAIQISEDPTIFQHSRNLTTWPRAAHGADRPCEKAFYEVQPRDSAWAENAVVCMSYNAVRMLFTAIQVAGPKLTVQSLDQGMHAIPSIPSGDPAVPACFYQPGDYTCVKDASAQWWDPNGSADRHSAPGCWVSIDDGRRYLTGEWPVQDVEVARQPSDTCNINY